MSYFVKGGTLPRSCGNCPHNYSSLKCKITNSEIDRDDEYKERLSDCPIVEVKEPHGELVDRTKLLAEYDRQHKGPAGGARKIIETAWTVLEAEGRET